MDKYFDMDDIMDDIPHYMRDEQSSEHDKDILETIVSSLQGYDILDYICKLSALNLVPYNQNKCIVFDKIIDQILLSELEITQGGNKMSPKKFKQLVENGMGLNVAIGIDPIEMPFMQRIQYYGNKWVFSGINSAPAYMLQNFIDVLHSRKDRFDPNFIIISDHIIHFILAVSTKIVEQVGYTKSVYTHHERREIVYPQATEHSRLSQAVIFEENEFDGIFDDRFREIVYYSKESTKDIELNYDSCTFYYRPFLKMEENKFLVLNPTMLVPFAIYNILQISTEYGCRHELVDLYNDKTWYECKQSLKMLDHKKINAKALGIELIDTNYYKEAIFNAFNDGVLFVRYFCDNARNYTFSNMFAFTTIEVDSIENRWKEVLELEGVLKKEKFYELTIINSLGRGVLLGFREEPCLHNITLSPFELFCISINERNHPNFLPYYMESRKKLNSGGIPSVAEINYVDMYVNNDYSFYVGDDVDPRTTLIWAGFGDSVDYLNKALLIWDKQLAEIPDSDFFKEIVLNEPERNIYCTIDKTNFTLMNRFQNIDIWVSAENPTSMDELNLLRSVLDLFTYWFSECKDIFENNSFAVKSLLVRNHFTGKIQDYYLANNLDDTNILSYLSSRMEGQTINIYWTPKAFLCLASKSNVPEKELIRWILSLIASFSEGKLEFGCFDLLFNDPLKTKVYALDYVEHPYFKPMIEKTRHIPLECEHQLLDEIGDYLRQIKGFEYGIIQGVEKNKICNDIVGFLYDKLKSNVSKFDPTGFYELLHFELEQIIYSMMLTQRRYSYDIACYPERAEKIDAEYNEINKSSIAIKFLLEYIAATPPSGELSLGEGDYEYMLTICSLIIEWAHNSDMFLYKMIDNDLEILRSGRIGLKKDRIEELANSNYIASRKRLNAISNPSVDLFTPQDTGSSAELDSAFEDEFSYTYTDLNICMLKLIDIGDTIKGDVKRMARDSVVELIEKDTAISKEKICKIIGDMSLSPRADYLTPPAGFSKYDILPWKFNRKLSFIRRPITLVNEDLIWGNRQLYHSLRYLYDLIAGSRLPARENGKLKHYLGRLIDSRGNRFNDVVADKLRGFESLIVDSKVKKINGQRIADLNGNDLGDIDVLVIVPSKKKIVVVEVKDFSFAKTPYEMHQQYLSVFCDEGGKLCYISKHKKRVAWIKEHIEDVVSRYKLDQSKWKVFDALVVDESITSNEFYHQNQTILLYSELTEETFKRIK